MSHYALDVYNSYWTDRTYRFRRPPFGPELAQDRRMHVSLVRDWLEQFRENERRHYRWRPIRKQWPFFEDPTEGCRANIPLQSKGRERRTCRHA